jgi:hypothetical protein
LAVDSSQAKQFTCHSAAAKEINLLGSPRQPRKEVYLAGVCAMKVLSALYLLWLSNSQGNNSWQLTAKDIDFPRLSTLGGSCLAVGRQEQLPWRQTYISWRFLATKAIHNSGSVGFTIT